MADADLSLTVGVDARPAEAGAAQANVAMDSMAMRAAGLTAQMKALQMAMSDVGLANRSSTMQQAAQDMGAFQKAAAAASQSATEFGNLSIAQFIKLQRATEDFVASQRQAFSSAQSAAQAYYNDLLEGERANKSAQDSAAALNQELTKQETQAAKTASAFQAFYNDVIQRANAGSQAVIGSSKAVTESQSALIKEASNAKSAYLEQAQAAGQLAFALQQMGPIDLDEIERLGKINDAEVGIASARRGEAAALANLAQIRAGIAPAMQAEIEAMKATLAQQLGITAARKEAAAAQKESAAAQASETVQAQAATKEVSAYEKAILAGGAALGMTSNNQNLFNSIIRGSIADVNSDAQAHAILAATLDHLGATAAQTRTATAALKASLSDSAAAASGAEAALGKTAAAIKKTKDEGDEFKVTAFQMTEVFRLLMDIFTGRTANFERTFAALISTTGLVQAVMSPIGLGIAAIGGYFLTAAASGERFNEQIGKLDLSLRTSSEGIGLTKSQLVDLADDIGQSATVSQSEARKIVDALAAVGDLTGKTFDEAAHGAQAFGLAMSTDPVKGATLLAKTLEDPAKGLMVLDQTFHIATPSLISYVDAQVKAGHAEEARSAVMDALVPKLQNLTNTLTPFQERWERLTAGISDAFDALGKSDRIKTLQQVVNQDMADLQKLQDKVMSVGKLEAGGGTTLTSMGFITVPMDEVTRQSQEALKALDEMRQKLRDDQGALDTEKLEAYSKAVDAAAQAQDNFVKIDVVNKVEHYNTTIASLTAAIQGVSESQAHMMETGKGTAATWDALVNTGAILKRELEELKDPANAMAQALERQTTATQGMVGADLQRAQALFQANEALRKLNPAGGDNQTSAASANALFGSIDSANLANQEKSIKLMQDRLAIEQRVAAAQSIGSAAVTVAGEQLTVFDYLVATHNEALAIQYAKTGDAKAVLAQLGDTATKAGAQFKSLTDGLRSDDVAKFSGVAAQMNKQLNDQADIMRQVAAAKLGDEAATRAGAQEEVQALAATASPHDAHLLRLKAEAQARQQVYDQTARQIQITNLELDAKRQIAEATLKSAAAGDQLRAVLEAQNQAIQKGLDPFQQAVIAAQNLGGKTVDLSQSIADQVVALGEENDALQRKIDFHGKSSAASENATRDAKADKEITELLTDATNQLTTAKEALAKAEGFDQVSQGVILVQQAEQRVQTANETATAMRTQTERADQLNLKLEAQNKEMSAFSKEVVNAANQVDRTLTSAIENALDGKKVTDWGATMKQMIAQIAAQIINIELIRPAIGSALGSIGLNQAAQAFAGGGAGGAAGAAGGLGSGSLGNATSFLSLGNQSGIFSGAGTSIGNFLFGAPASGIQSIAESGISAASAGGGLPSAALSGASGVGPTAGAVPFSSGGGIGGASLSTIGTGIGGVAGVAGGIMGLMNAGNQNGLGIAGDVGQLAGGGLALASLLPGLSALGPWGLAIAAVSAIVSSLFGNKHPQHPTGQAEAVLNSSGGGTGDFVDFTTDHGNAADLHDAVNNMLLPFSTSISSQFGADLSGTRLGILNNAGTTSFSTGRVGDNNPKDQSQPISQLFQFDQKDQNSVNDALTHVTLALLQMATKVNNADLSVARFNIDITDTAANIQKYIQFAVDFSANTKSLNEGGGFDPSKSIIGAAQQQADQLQQQANDFMDTTRKLFPGTEQTGQIQIATASIKSYLETLIGLKDPVDQSLTPMETAMKTMRANLDALTPLLNQFGISADDVAQAVATATKKLQDTAIKAITTADNSALGKDYLNQIPQIIASEAANIRDLASSNLGPDQAVKLAKDQTASLLKGLTDDDVKDVIKNFIDTAGSADILSVALLQLQSSTVKTAQAQEKALSDFKVSLRQFADSLLVGDLSPLSPSDQLQVAQNQFYNDLAAGNSGDTSAQGRVQGDAQTYLKLARDFYASSQAYTDIFNKVEQALGQTKSVEQVQQDIMRNQLTTQQQMLDSLHGIQHALDGHATTTGGVTGAGGAGGRVQDLIATANGPVSRSAADDYLAANHDVLVAATLHTLGLPMDWTAEQVAAWHFANFGQAEGRTWDGNQSFLPTGQGSQAGGHDVTVTTSSGVISKAAADAYLQANPDVKAAYDAGQVPVSGMSAEDFAAWHDAHFGQSEGRIWDGGTIPHLSAGGVVTGGIAGMDTRPIYTTPGEGVVSLAGMQTLARINSGAGIGDSNAMLSAMNAMTDVMKRVLQVGGITAGVLEELMPVVAKNTSDTASANKRANS